MGSALIREEMGL